jgi:uncharacterized protein YndB with AHSA1/START domain
MMHNRIDRASLRIAATPKRLYDAFVQASALIQWLPPRGAHGTIDALEPWPGGDFRMTLVFDEAASSGGKTTSNTDVISGHFVDLIPGERIALAINFVSDDPAFAGTMTMTWSFAPEHASTQVTVTAIDVPSGIGSAEHEIGMKSSLENLAAYMERSAVT